MEKTKIEWCDSTWNPVTGCRNDCVYCYARRMANRFSAKEKDKTFYGGKPYTWVNGIELHELEEPATTFDGFGKDIHGFVTPKWRKEPYPFGFEPTLHKYKLDQPTRWKEAKNVFVCSMADLFGDWVPDDWIKAVFDACDTAPKHRYIFLTKNPGRYMKMYNARVIREHNERHPESPHPQTEEYKNVLPLPRRDNWWYGSSVDSMKAGRANLGLDHTFVSIEPLTERLDVGLGSFGGDEWIIIGAETGARKGKTKPEKEWVDTICKAADITHAAVFMKDSLIKIMGEENMRREFPWDKEQKGANRE